MNKREAIEVLLKAATSIGQPDPVEEEENDDETRRTFAVRVDVGTEWVWLAMEVEL